MKNTKKSKQKQPETLLIIIALQVPFFCLFDDFDNLWVLHCNPTLLL